MRPRGSSELPEPLSLSPGPAPKMDASNHRIGTTIQVPTPSTSSGHTWGKQGLSARAGVQEGRQAIRMPHTHGMEVREKRPRGFN
jgi:hypothetical protein